MAGQQEQQPWLQGMVGSEIDRLLRLHIAVHGQRAIP